MSPTTTSFTLSPMPSIRFRDAWDFLLPLLCFGALLAASQLLRRPLDMAVGNVAALDYFSMPKSYWQHIISESWPILMLTAILFRIAGAVVPVPEADKARWAWGWLSLTQISLFGLALIGVLLIYGIATNGPIILFV